MSTLLSYCNRFSSEVVDASCFLVFKNHLDNALTLHLSITVHFNFLLSPKVVKLLNFMIVWPISFSGCPSNKNFKYICHIELLVPHSSKAKSVRIAY